MKILTDADLTSFPMIHAIEAIRDFFQSAALGNVVTPPRHSVTAGNGRLAFTIGAELETSKTTGFRVYDTYPNRDGTNTDQIVAVYSTEQSELKGIIVGSRIGALRTAAINGYALDILAHTHITTACLIGAGHQAFYQLQALLAVRSVKKIIVCNRSIEKAHALVDTFRDNYRTTDFSISTDIEQAVRQSDVVMCATSSEKPVIQSEWLQKNCYIASIGPKFSHRHELPTDIGNFAKRLVSDAPQQIQAYADEYFLDYVDGIIALENVACGASDGITAFLSSGRSGTEVIVANRIIEYCNVT